MNRIGRNSVANVGADAPTNGMFGDSPPHSNTGVINLERGDKYRNIRRYRPIDLLYSVKN